METLKAKEFFSSFVSIFPSLFFLLHLFRRFLFILLGPSGRAKSYNEIGRAIATLMVDDVSETMKQTLSAHSCGTGTASPTPQHHQHSWPLLCTRDLRIMRLREETQTLSCRSTIQ